MAFEFKPDDTLLINRGDTSYTITALDAKNVVNPEGILIKPTIDSTSSGPFINGQGLPIESERIKLVRTTGTDVVMTLTIENSSTNLSGIDAFPCDIVSNEYVPLTTPITNIEVAGNLYTYSFLTVNYDYGLFQVGDEVIGGGQYKGKINSKDVSLGKITIESTDTGWSSINNKRIEYDVSVDGQNPVTATGKLESFTIDSSSQVTCIISNVTGIWMDSYNNRNQTLKFDAASPRGGYEIDANGCTFTASAFDMRDKTSPTEPNKVLTLQKVLWRINGKEISGTVAPGNVPQTLDVPPNIMYDNRNLTNSITVTYLSGNYRETSERYLFKSDLNPRTGTTTVDLLNRVTGFQTDLTTLGL